MPILLVAGVAALTVAVPESVWDLTDGAGEAAVILLASGAVLLMLVPPVVLYVCERAAKMGRRPLADPRDTERCAAESRLVRELLAGALDRGRYQTEMAALAACTMSPPAPLPDDPVWRVGSLVALARHGHDRVARIQVGRLVGRVGGWAGRWWPTAPDAED